MESKSIEKVAQVRSFSLLQPLDPLDPIHERLELPGQEVTETVEVVRNLDDGTPDTHQRFGGSHKKIEIPCANSKETCNAIGSTLSSGFYVICSGKNGVEGSSLSERAAGHWVSTTEVRVLWGEYAGLYKESHSLPEMCFERCSRQSRRLKWNRHVWRPVSLGTVVP